VNDSVNESVKEEDTEVTKEEAVDTNNKFLFHGSASGWSKYWVSILSICLVHVCRLGK